MHLVYRELDNVRANRAKSVSKNQRQEWSEILNFLTFTEIKLDFKERSRAPTNCQTFCVQHYLKYGGMWWHWAGEKQASNFSNTHLMLDKLLFALFTA